MYVICGDVFNDDVEVVVFDYLFELMIVVLMFECVVVDEFGDLFYVGY